jgi:CHASE2 domain-containing sensor protein
VLNFAGDRYAFARYSSSAVIEQSAAPGWAAEGPLRDRLVIVGGAFRAARDEYRTPLGPMTGADIVAHAVASEVHGGGIRGTNKAKEKLVELTVAVLIVFVGFRGYKRTALASEVILIPLVALAGSWFAFSTLGRWSSFAPYWVGMAIQQALTSLSPAAREAAAAPLPVAGSGLASPSGPAPGVRTPRGHGSRRRRRRRG